MSITAKATLAASCLVTAGIIGYVHYKQNLDRSKLHEGVIRDVERQQRRKIENTYKLQQQIELTKELKKQEQYEKLLQSEKENQTRQKMFSSTTSRWSSSNTMVHSRLSSPIYSSQTRNVNTGEVIFEKLIPVQSHIGASDERTQTLKITVVLHASASQLSRKDMQIEVTDESDPFTLLSLRLTEDDFANLKAQQGLLIDFAAFPARFVQLLDKCCGEETNSPKFLLLMKFNSDLTTGKQDAVIEIVETNPFKHLCHLSLLLKSGNDTQVRAHLSKKFRFVKEENERLLELLRQNEQSLELEKRLSAQKVAELDHLKANFNSKLGELEEKLNLKFQTEKQQLIQANLEAEQRYERDKLQLKDKHDRELLELDHRYRLAETQNREILEKKQKLESSLRDTKNLLGEREAELMKMREELSIARQRSAHLDSDYHDKERTVHQLRSRLAAAEQELREKENQVGRLQEMVKNTQDAKAKLEAEYEQRAAVINRRETAVKALTDELLKANEIIRKLQSEVKTLSSKVKVRTEVASEQERLLSQKEDELRQVRADWRAAAETTEQLQQQLRERENQMAAAKERAEQLEKQLKSDENIITWLNKQLNDVQLGRPASNPPANAAAGKFSYPFASTPSSGDAQQLPTLAVSTVRKIPQQDNRENDAPLDPVYYQPISYGLPEAAKHSGGILPVDRGNADKKKKPSAYFNKK